MSALFDGKQYLIEKYTTHNVLSADLTDVHDKLSIGTQNNSVLAMGVSNAVGKFPPLPNVPKELDAIAKTNTSNQGIYPGKEYLNSAFDDHSLRDNLTGYKILHLATHGAFVPGSKDASYLLLGNGDKLAISDIYITEERWEHIIDPENHPEMEECEDKLKETIRSGRRTQDPLNPQKYRYTKAFDDLPFGNTHIVAIVLCRFKEGKLGQPIPNNYVVTAYQKVMG